MSNDLREKISQYYIDNPNTELKAIEVADLFSFLPHLPHQQRTSIVRGIKKRAKHKALSSLVLRSRWDAQKKGGEIIQLESYRVPATERQNQFLELLNGVKESIAKTLKENSPTIKTPKVEPGETLIELNIPDYHFGRLDGRTIDEQCEDYLKAIKTLVERSSGFKPDKYLLVIGNDQFQVDTAFLTTTKGTKVETNCDYDEMYSKGLTAMLKAVTYLATLGKVDVINVRGNHDEVLSFTAAEAIRHYFSGTAHVNVFNAFGQDRKYYEFGSCLIVYTHGDKEKPQDMPLIMAVERPELFAICPYRYVKMGHLHHSIVKEYQGVKVEVVSSLASSDKWHRKFGYLSKPKAQVTIYHKEQGEIGTFVYNNY